MKNERNSQGVTPYSLQRAGKIGLALINPLSDVGYLYRHGIQPVMNNLRRIRKTLRRSSVEGQKEKVSCVQAIEQTGVRGEILMRNYGYIRLFWWLFMMLTGGFAVILTLLLLFSGLNIPVLALIRAAVTVLVLAAAAGVGFVKTAEATWHLWQLSVQRVSKAECGTFGDFWTEENGIKSLLRPVYRHR